MESSKEGLEYGFTKQLTLSTGPAVSVPVAEVQNLPVSAHIIGPPFGDKTVLEIAAAIESRRDYVRSNIFV